MNSVGLAKLATRDRIEEAGRPVLDAAWKPAAAPSTMGRVLSLPCWALADQTIISATNFLTMVLLARGMGQTDFGSFTLVYSVLLFASNLQSALITQPHNIVGTRYQATAYRLYTTSTALAQLFFAAAVASAVFACSLVASAVGSSAALLLILLAPAIVTWQLQEFVRRVLYTEQRVAAACLNDLLSYGGQGIVIVALWRLDSLTPVAALQAMAATSAVAAAFGFAQVRGSLTREFNVDALRENWRFGKWLAGGELLRWFSSVEMYQYLAAAMLGPAAVATLRSTQIVFGPARLLVYGLNNVLPLQFADAFTAGRSRLDSLLTRVAAVTLIPLGLYCALVALCATPLLRFLYGDRYAEGATVLVLYAASAFLAYASVIASAALKARRLTRELFGAYVCTGLIAVCFGWLFMNALGVQGALVAMIVTSTVANVMFWRAYRTAVPERAHLYGEHRGWLP